MSSSGPVEEGSAKALEKFGFAIPPSPPAVFTGYLWKLSRGFVKTWKYRFFVIQGQCVKYYTDDTLTTVKGSFYFNQQSEVKYGLYRHEGRANILLLHSAHDSGSAHVMYVSSASVEEQKRWYDAFNAAIATSFPSILRTEIWPTKFSPKTALGVVFNGINGTAEMEDGNIVEIDDMAQQPTIYFNAPSAGSSRHYSLLLVSFNDGIKASPKNSSKVSYTSTILWLTCNLPHSSLETIISRYEILPYQPPDVPDLFATPHVFCILFEQKQELEVNKTKISVSRRDLPVADLIQKMNLVLPAGINGCYVKRTPLSISNDFRDEGTPIDDVDFNRNGSFGPPSLVPSSAHSSSSRNSAIMYRIPEDGELDLDQLLIIGSPRTREGCLSPSSDSGSFSLVNSSSVGSKRVSFTSTLSPGLQTNPSTSEMLSSDSNNSTPLGPKLTSVMKSSKGRPSRKKTVSFKLEAEQHFVSNAIPDEIAMDIYDFDDQPDYEMEYYTSQASSSVSNIAASSSPVITSKKSKEALLLDDDEVVSKVSPNSNSPNTSPKSTSISTPTVTEKKSVQLSINAQAEEVAAEKKVSPSPKGGSLARGVFNNSFVIHRNKGESPKSSSIPNNSSVDSFADLTFVEKVSRFSSPEAAALYFNVKSSSLFTGEMVKKKFSSDYFMKQSFVYLDVLTLTLRWTKSADLKNGQEKHKYITFNTTNLSQDKLVGECKGEATHAMQLDRTLTIYLKSGQMLLLEGTVAMMVEWCKVLNAIIQEKK